LENYKEGIYFIAYIPLFPQERSQKREEIYSIIDDLVISHILTDFSEKMVGHLCTDFVGSITEVIS